MFALDAIKCFFLCSIIRNPDILCLDFISDQFIGKTFAHNQITTHKMYYNVAMNVHGHCQNTTGLAINLALFGIKVSSLECTWMIGKYLHLFLIEVNTQ